MSKGAALAALGVLAALLLIVSGCGGSNSTAGEPTSLTRAQFVTKATEICKRGEVERGKLLQEGEGQIPKGEKITPAIQKRVILSALVSPYRAMAKELNEFAPSGEEEEVEEIVLAMEQAARKAEAQPLVSLHSDIQFQKANKMLEKYGLTSCVV